jgi:hypothetical protein
MSSDCEENNSNCAEEGLTIAEEESTEAAAVEETSKEAGTKRAASSSKGGKRQKKFKSEFKIIKGASLEQFLEHLNTACQATAVEYKRCQHLLPGQYRLLKLYPAHDSEFGTINGLVRNLTTEETFITSMPGTFKDIPEQFYGVYDNINLLIEKSEGRKGCSIKLIKEEE